MADYDWFQAENCQCHRAYGSSHKNWCEKSPHREMYENGYSKIEDTSLYWCRGCGCVVASTDTHDATCELLVLWRQENVKPKEPEYYSAGQLSDIVTQAIMNGESIDDDTLNQIADQLHRLDSLES